MKKFTTYFLLFAAMSVSGVSCDYMEADDVCYATRSVESCSELNDHLELCDPDAETNVPGCAVAYELDANGNISKEFCDGQPVPCDVLDESECSVADNCSWFYDPDNVDREAE